jgi:hypothetical protein
MPTDQTHGLVTDGSKRGDQRDIDRVFAAYYPLQPSKDVCFELARLLMGLTEYAGALAFFARSRAACGPHHVTSHNEGICLFYLGRRDDASSELVVHLLVHDDEAARRAEGPDEAALIGHGGDRVAIVHKDKVDD